jgi:hypothetical protein
MIFLVFRKEKMRIFVRLNIIQFITIKLDFQNVRRENIKSRY